MNETAAQRDPAMFGQLDYERRHAEAYFTEPWITGTLTDHVAPRGRVWEPACGRGDMAAVLVRTDFVECVTATDLYDHGPDYLGHHWFKRPVDFLAQYRATAGIGSIVTNPPFKKGLAEKFVRHALGLMNHPQGMVCMLLRHEFDCAKTRADLFTEWPFRLKLTLTRRPRWDWWEREKPQASPRHNFAWYVWDFQHEGPRQLAWGQ